MTPAPLIDRFMAKVMPEPNSGCWLWTGTTAAYGYGQIHADGRTQLAYSVGYRLLIGPIPVNLELDHKCRVRCCVNPDHLEPVTHAENVRRGNAGVNNSVKTRCPHGHAYSPENTYIMPSGSRFCRACGRDRSRRQSRRAA